MRLLDEMKINHEKPIAYVDNQSAISIARDRTSSKRSKHMDIRYHYIRELIEEGLVDIKYVETKNMLADSLTKTLTGKKFMDARYRLLNPKHCFMETIWM